MKAGHLPASPCCSSTASCGAASPEYQPSAKNTRRLSNRHLLHTSLCPAFALAPSSPLSAKSSDTVGSAIHGLQRALVPVCPQQLAPSGSSGHPSSTPAKQQKQEAKCCFDFQATTMEQILTSERRVRRLQNMRLPLLHLLWWARRERSPLPPPMKADAVLQSPSLPCRCRPVMHPAAKLHPMAQDSLQAPRET